VAKSITKLSPEGIVKYRFDNNLSQSQFWTPIFISQSCGSRYESGRSMPKPVQALVKMTYGTEAEAQKILAKLRGAAVEEKEAA